MIKSEWVPSSKLHPCFLCGNQSGWCSTSTTDPNTIVCKNTTTTESGWKKLKDTIDGGGVFKLIDPENYARDRHPFPQQTQPDTQYQPTNHHTRDRVYRRLITKNGHLSSTYRAELKRRGLSDRQIESAIERGWFGNWQRGINCDFTSDRENIAGINPTTNLTCSCDGLFVPAIKDGQIVGGQIYPQPHVEQKLGRSVNVPEDLGKYIWLSSSKHGGVNAHSFDTGENPLFLREHPDTQLEQVENLNLCEGALKSAIAALKFGERGSIDPFLGAAGGWFSEQELYQCLTRYPNLKTVTLYPDAGSSHNPSILGHYHRAIDLIETATSGKVKTNIAWWGQTSNHLTAVAYINNPDRDGAALHLEFKTIRGDIHRWTMCRANLAGEGTAIAEGLLSRDYSFSRKQKNLLFDYLHGLGAKLKNNYTVTDSTGWVKDSFVLPHKTYGDPNLKFREVDPSPEAITEVTGSLQGWKDNVAAGRI